MESHRLTGPLGLLREAWRLYRPRWKLLSGLIFVPYAAMIIAQNAALIARKAGVAQSVAIDALAAIVGIAALISVIAAVAGSLDAIAKSARDPGASLDAGAQYAVGFKLFWPFVWVAIIGAAVGIGSFSLLVVPYVIFFVYASLAIVALVVDGKRGVSAFVESFSLVRGHWWAVLGRLAAAVLAIFVAPSLIIAGIAFILQSVAGFAAYSALGLAVAGALRVVLMAVMYPIWLAYIYALAESLRPLRTEGGAVAFKRWVIALGVVGIGAIALLVASVVAAVGSRMRTEEGPGAPTSGSPSAVSTSTVASTSTPPRVPAAHAPMIPAK